MGELRVPSVFGIDVKSLSIKKLTKSNIVGIDIKIESGGTVMSIEGKMNTLTAYQYHNKFYTRQNSNARNSYHVYGYLERYLKIAMLVDFIVTIIEQLSY